MIPEVRCPKCGNMNTTEEQFYKGLDCVVRVSDYRCSKCGYNKATQEFIPNANNQQA